MNINVNVLNKDLYKELPKRATDGSAGFDLILPEKLILSTGKEREIKTGLSLEMPVFKKGDDMFVNAFILPRSGLGRRGLHISNVIGLIDNDYTGEIIVWVKWMGRGTLILERGDKFCQMAFVPFYKCNLTRKRGKPRKTERGSGGFGSTG